MAKYDYDLICIGLGPAGMAVSVMGSEMGLKVCSIEKNKIGGECMNVGCIPSKSLLKMAEARHTFSALSEMELEITSKPAVKNPFGKIQEYLKYISEAKTTAMFKKVDLILGQGDARFVDDHTVEAGGRRLSAGKIFIATGTEPMVPPIPGIDTVDYLTNNNLFTLDRVPASLTIIGGGAIGSEMAQAFSRLGCKCTIVQMDAHLIPLADEEAARLVEEAFKKENIDVHNSAKIESVRKDGDQVALQIAGGPEITSEKLLVAAGRRIDLSPLGLDTAGVRFGKRGIEVNARLQTNRPHIYAVGDCNGKFLLSHAAMHQGMLALMNAIKFNPIKFNYLNYVVPWTVFTDPQVSCVGMTEKELKQKNVRYETHVSRYEDYGAAIAENIPAGFVKVFVSAAGRVYGACIVGEGSGEMINEWALIIQKKVRMHEVMFLQHSFPTMGFLSKRVSEMWMMAKMKSPAVKKLCKMMF